MKKLVDILILLVGLPLVAQVSDRPLDKALFERAIDSVVQVDMEAARAPGAMILVSRNGEPLFEKPYGVRNARTKEPVTSSTLFLTASVTKTITTTTLLIFCHEKGIPTETSIGSLLERRKREGRKRNMNEKGSGYSVYFQQGEKDR